MKTEQLPDLVLVVALVTVLAFAASWTVSDPDLWGHVRFGRDIIAAGSIPRHDPYSFTSDMAWVNHEWLAEVLMASAYGVAGAFGLIALKVVLVVGTCLITWSAVRRAGVFRPLATVLLLLATIGAYGLMLTVRPQLFSMLLYASLLASLNAAGRGRKSLFLCVPVIFAVWANLHGGWIVGLGVFLVWGACGAVAGILPGRWVAAGVLLGLLSALATPYGLGLWTFLRATVGLGRADIGEWQPLFRDPTLLLVWIASAAFVAAAWRRCGKGALPLLIPVILIGAMSFRVARLEGFFTLAAVILLAPCFRGLGPENLPLSRRPSRSDIALVGAMCLAGFVAAGVGMKSRLSCIAITTSEVKGSWAPEAEAVTFLAGNELQGRLLSYFDYGEMAIWHLAPRLRVSYDGRRETVYSTAVQSAHNRFYAGKDGAGYATRLGADYIWLPQRLPVILPLERDGWVEIFRGPLSVVLAKTSRRFTQPAPWKGPRCFPGP